MSDSERLVVEVFLDSHVPTGHERMLVDALAAIGVRTQVKGCRPSWNWGVAVAGFGYRAAPGISRQRGKQLAEDTYQGLKRAVGRLLGRRDQEQPAAEQPPLVLQDTSSGLQVVLEADLSDAAYQQLVGLDLAQFQLGPLHYDRQLRRWRSELDEGSGAPGDLTPASPASCTKSPALVVVWS